MDRRRCSRCGASGMIRTLQRVLRRLVVAKMMRLVVMVAGTGCGGRGNRVVGGRRVIVRPKGAVQSSCSRSGNMVRGRRVEGRTRVVGRRVVVEMVVVRVRSCQVGLVVMMLLLLLLMRRLLLLVVVVHCNGGRVVVVVVLLVMMPVRIVGVVHHVAVVVRAVHVAMV